MKFFVYGTLKRGYGNNAVLGNSEFIGRAVTLRPFFMRCCGFPVVLHGPETAPVLGEVYNVTDPHIERDLDRLEGVPNMYLRQETQVQIEGRDEPETVNIYIGNNKNWRNPEYMRDVPLNAAGQYEWHR